MTMVKFIYFKENKEANEVYIGTKINKRNIKAIKSLIGEKLDIDHDDGKLIGVSV